MAVYKFDYCCMGRLFGMLQYGLIQQTKRRLDGSLDQSINQQYSTSQLWHVQLRPKEARNTTIRSTTSRLKES